MFSENKSPAYGLILSAFIRISSRITSTCGFCSIISFLNFVARPMASTEPSLFFVRSKTFLFDFLTVVEFEIMSLISTIQTDLTAALKAGDVKTKETLRFIVSQLKYKEIELKRVATDEEVVTTIRKQIKELEESKAQFLLGKREDLATENDEQVKILQKYLPSEVSDEELEKMVRGFIEANRQAFNANPKALTGKVVAALRAKAAPSRIAAMYGRVVQ